MIWENRIHSIIDYPHPIESYSYIWHPDMNSEWRQAAEECIQILRFSIKKPYPWDTVKEQLEIIIDKQFPDIRDDDKRLLALSEAFIQIRNP